METSVVMSFWYPYMALSMRRVPAPTVTQKKWPLFDPFRSVRAEALTRKGKVCRKVSGVA